MNHKQIISNECDNKKLHLVDELYARSELYNEEFLDLVLERNFKKLSSLYYERFSKDDRWLFTHFDKTEFQVLGKDVKYIHSKMYVYSYHCKYCVPESDGKDV